MNSNFSFIDISAPCGIPFNHLPIPDNVIDEIQRMEKLGDLAKLKQLEISEADGNAVAHLCPELAQRSPEVVRVLARHKHVSLHIYRLLKVEGEGPGWQALKEAISADDAFVEPPNEVPKDDHQSTKFAKQLKERNPGADLKKYVQSGAYRELEKAYIKGVNAKNEQAAVREMVQRFGASEVVEFFLGALESQAVNRQQLAVLVSMPARVDGQTCSLLHAFIDQDPRYIQNLYLLFNKLSPSAFDVTTLQSFMIGAIQLGADHVNKLHALTENTWMHKLLPKLLTAEALGAALRKEDRQVVDALAGIVEKAGMPSADVAHFLACREALASAIETKNLDMIEAYSDVVLGVQRNPKTRLALDDARRLKKIINSAHMTLQGVSGVFSFATNTASYTWLTTQKGSEQIQGIAKKFSDAKDALKPEFYADLSKRQ